MLSYKGKWDLGFSEVRDDKHQRSNFRDRCWWEIQGKAINACHSITGSQCWSSTEIHRHIATCQECLYCTFHLKKCISTKIRGSIVKNSELIQTAKCCHVGKQIDRRAWRVREDGVPRATTHFSSFKGLLKSGQDDLLYRIPPPPFQTPRWKDFKNNSRNWQFTCWSQSPNFLFKRGLVHNSFLPGCTTGT